MLGTRLGVAAIALIASSSLAFAACEGDVVLFEDRFEVLQPTWGEESDSLRIENGRLMLEPRVASDLWAASRASLYDDIDMCVSLTTIRGVDPEEAKAGLVFWHSDVNNFYVFEIAPNGKASVWRRQRGKWLEQVGWRDVDGIEVGDGESNTLRVVTRGDRVVVHVNETEVADFTGDAPDNGQQIGVFASSPEAGEALFAFDDLRVTRP